MSSVVGFLSFNRIHKLYCTFASMWIHFSESKEIQEIKSKALNFRKNEWNFFFLFVVKFFLTCNDCPTDVLRMFKLLVHPPVRTFHSQFYIQVAWILLWRTRCTPRPDALLEPDRMSVLETRRSTRGRRPSPDVQLLA